MNRIWNYLLCAVMVPLLGSGCVLKTKYDEALLQLDECEQSVVACNSENATLNESLASCGQAKQEALQQIDDLIAQLEALGTDVTRLQAERSKVANELALAEDQLAEMERKRAAEQARLATFRKMLEQFQAMIDSGQIEVKIERGRMVVKMASAILFGSGSTTLKEEGKTVIAEVSAVLTGIEGRSFQVEGHTDDQPMNSARYPSNWELSAARATEVVKFMVDNGMPPERISGAGYAEFMPVSSNEDKDGRALNRRIEIVLLPNMDELPDLSALEEEN